MYTVRILKPASRELERFDKVIARRVVERIRWLAENFEEIKPKALTGELAGLYKLREGDYVLFTKLSNKRKRLLFIASVIAEMFIRRSNCFTNHKYEYKNPSVKSPTGIFSYFVSISRHKRYSQGK